MASRQQFEDALIAAHEAGDTEAARLIASEIKNLAPTSRPADPSLYSKTDAFKNAALSGARALTRAIGLTGYSAASAGASIPLAAADAGLAVRGAITGEKDLPSASQMWRDSLAIKPETTAEKVSDFANQVLIGSKIPAPGLKNAAPASFDPKAMRTVALEKAQKAGLVVPPSTTNPTLMNRFLESWGGKIATAQDASLRNQPKIDALVKSDLGLSAADDVGEGTLAAIRKEAAQTGYAPVKGVGTMRLDSQFSQSLDKIAAPFARAEKAFPGLNKNDILSSVESLKQKSVDSETAIDSIQILRDKAELAFRQGDTGVGRAYKAMAKELESAVERSLSRRGQDAQKMLSDFRNARQLIAKTHSAEKALNPELGSFDARKLAQQLNQGKPLSGGMKKAGQAAQAFKEASTLRTDSGSVRNTDVMFGAGAAALSGEPAALLYPFSRMAARDLLLSPWWQRNMAVPGRGALPPGAVMGGATGLLGP